MASIQPLDQDGCPLTRVDVNGRVLGRHERGGRPAGTPTKYRVWWRDAKGRSASKVVPTLRDARAVLREVHRQEATGELTDRLAGRQALADLYEEVHAVRRYAPATAAVHEVLWSNDRHGGIRPAMGDRAIGSISAANVDAFLATVERPAMREKSRRLLSVLFEHAVDQRRLNVNPAKARRRASTRAERLELEADPRDKRYLTDDELDQLLDALPERYRALALVMARLGLRPGEAYALRVVKFDPLHRRLVVDTSLSGFTKTGRSRELVMPRYVADVLVEHLARFSSPADPNALVFQATDGGQINPNNFRNRTWTKALERAGIESDLTPNHLRHTAASYAFRHGATVLEVQRMLGHSKPSITLDVYAHLMDDSLERLADRLDAAVSGLVPLSPTEHPSALSRHSTGNTGDSA